MRHEMNDKKIWIIISAVSGFTTVALGAFGAHGLKSTISAEMLEIFKTGIFYQFVHTIVLLILSVTNFIKGKISSILFLLGIILFSFSLYLYSTSGIKIFAIITPVGGVCFLIGWLGIIIEVVRKKQ
jgi:uncharacterized membrane protein YgdD (TMEM256/DUF423 family)